MGAVVERRRWRRCDCFASRRVPAQGDVREVRRRRTDLPDHVSDPCFGWVPVPVLGPVLAVEVERERSGPLAPQMPQRQRRRWQR
jgi:hypothetical protein